MKFYFLCFSVFNPEHPFRHVFFLNLRTQILTIDKRSFGNLCCEFLYWVFVKVLGRKSHAWQVSQIPPLGFQVPPLRWVLGLRSHCSDMPMGPGSWVLGCIRILGSHFLDMTLMFTSDFSGLRFRLDLNLKTERLKIHIKVLYLILFFIKNVK